MPSELKVIWQRLENSLKHTSYFGLYNQAINDFKSQCRMFKFLVPKYQQFNDPYIIPKHLMSLILVLKQFYKNRAVVI